MSKEKLQLISPLFLKYQDDFEKNPKSRVFAPLAEAYRKIGMIDKAMHVLSQGIRHHPTYMMGYLGLAFCYFDLKQFHLSYSTLRPLVESNRDNLRLQKLFADTCMQLGHEEEALETLKYLLFVNPKDKDVASIVLSLEEKIENKFKSSHSPIVIPESAFENNDHSNEDLTFNTNSLNVKSENDFDDWFAVDLGKDNNAKIKEESKNNNWSMTNLAQVNKEKSVVKLNLNSIQSKINPKIEKQPIINFQEEVPLVTHTLVDLYCGQGHIEKALEVLEKILELNPNDQRTINKIHEIQALFSEEKNENEYESEADSDLSMQDTINSQEYNIVDIGDFTSERQSEAHNEHKYELAQLEDVSEEDGRKNLMSLIDEKFTPIEVEHSKDLDLSDKVQKIESKLSKFLQKIQKRALDYQSRI